MSFAFKDTQLFFKGLLQERIQSPSEYKEYSHNFALNFLDFDLLDNDIQEITDIIKDTEKLNNLSIRLSETLTSASNLHKLLRKIQLKRQFTTLSFYIKYLNDELLEIFIEFLGKLNPNITSLEINLKYKDDKKESEIMKKIMEHLLLIENSGLWVLIFKNCTFNTEENLNLLNKFLEKNKKLKQIILSRKRIYNNNFTPDISSLDRVDFIYCYISYINTLPIKHLNLAFNNISQEGLKHIVKLISSNNCTLKKLNISYNHIGDQGSIILSEGFRYNKSIISLDVSGNNILNKGLIAFAKNIKSEFNTTLKTIIFRYNPFDDDGIIEFCKILINEPNDKFKKVEFGVNYVEDEGINNYGHFLNHFSNINNISITNPLKEETQNNFFNHCNNMFNLKKIFFYNIGLTENSTESLNNLLLNNKNIQKFSIMSNRNLGPNGISNICPGIQNNTKITHIFLSTCNIGDLGAINLANALFKNINIKEINLEENKIGENGIKKLCEKVFGKISLLKINLGRNLINSKGAEFISDSLVEASNLQSLLLNSNQIGDEGCKNLCKGLEKNDSLIELNLDNNKITDIGIKEISKILKYKENLMSLSVCSNEINDIKNEFYEVLDWVKIFKISSNPLSSGGIVSLFTAPIKNRMLKKLRFKTNELHKFSKIIPVNNYLKDFDLSYNPVNLSLIKNILSLTHLSKLNLQRNDIKDKEIACFTEYIKQLNPPLKELLLHSNLISIEGSLSIANLIKDNKFLLILNISYNPLYSEGVGNICESITNNTNVLEELLIDDTKCNDFCVTKMVTMLKKNKKLSVLSINSNKFTNKGIDSILSTLRYNSNLKKLSLLEHYIDSKAFINLADYLKFNNTLLELEIRSSKLNDDILKNLSKVMLNNKSLFNINFADNILSYEGILSLGQYINKNNSIVNIKVLLNKFEKSEEPLIKSCNAHLVFS